MKVSKKELFKFCDENNDAINELQSRSDNTDFLLAVLIQQLKDSGVIDEISPEPKPQLKQLDQSAFDHPYATDRFKYVALNADGQAVFFESKPVISNCLDIWVVHTGSVMPMLKGFDTSDWQNSLIERDDIAKELLEVDLSSELTGSDLARAMLARGDKYVLCHLSQTSEKSAKDVLGIAIGHDHSGFRVQRHNSWQYAVPINNQGEPLTASEAGL